ncbi:MAG: preprotein translocase subunit YajC [Arachnia sp.]
MPPGLDLILMLVAFGALMYFLMIRPQQKRMREHEATMAALEPGVRVILTSGIFATLRHMGDSQAIVELAPGTEVTVLKGNIARPAKEDEEEFEFTDELDELVEADPEGIDDGAADASSEFDPRPEGSQRSDGA